MAFSTKGPKLATSMTTMVPEEEEVEAEEVDSVPFRVVEITNAIYIHYCRIHTIGVNYLDWLVGGCPIGNLIGRQSRWKGYFGMFSAAKGRESSGKQWTSGLGI